MLVRVRCAWQLPCVPRGGPSHMLGVPGRGGAGAHVCIDCGYLNTCSHLWCRCTCPHAPVLQEVGESGTRARGAPRGPSFGPACFPQACLHGGAGQPVPPRPTSCLPFRALELKEPQVLGEPRAGDAPQKVSGSSQGGVHITLTPVRVDRTPGPAGTSLLGNARQKPPPAIPSQATRV